MKVFLLVVISFLATVVNVNAQETEHDNYVPQAGYVPDEQTAIKIAEAVLGKIYGAEKIESEKPFKASLKAGVWTVSGSLPPKTFGGVASIEISKKDGRIHRVTHGK